MVINTVESSFTQYADTYDEFSGVQRETAERLIGLTVSADTVTVTGKRDRRRVKDILEIGCGTGNYTALLREAYPAARIAAFDISGAMIARARAKMPAAGVRFAVMDAEAMPAAGAFDIVTSNACFHWFRDMDAAIARYAGMLTPGGLFTVSVFGPRTLCELAESFRMAGKSIFARPREFPPQDALAGMMGKYFRGHLIEEAVYSRAFDSLLDLLRMIKYSGVRGDAQSPEFLFTPDLTRKIEGHYRREYGGIRVTFQVFFMKGYR